MSKYDLVGVDRNAFFIMGYVSNALRREGLKDKIAEYQAKATSSDYDHLLAISIEYVDLANEAAVKNGYEEIEDEY